MRKRKIMNNLSITGKGWLLALLPFLIACGEEPTPKPFGYMRIDLPEKSYEIKQFHCPFSFEIPDYARLEMNRPGSDHECWFNIGLPRFDAKIHFTYKEVNDSNLRGLLEESHTLTYEHQVKANAINAMSVNREDARVFGTVYRLKGDVASPVQLYITDSTDHFLRGSLYFRARPNADSIAPVEDFIAEDINRFVESFSWKR